MSEHLLVNPYKGDSGMLFIQHPLHLHNISSGFRHNIGWIIGSNRVKMAHISYRQPIWTLSAIIAGAIGSTGLFVGSIQLI